MRGRRKDKCCETRRSKRIVENINFLQMSFHVKSYVGFYGIKSEIERGECTCKGERKEKEGTERNLFIVREKM